MARTFLDLGYDVDVMSPWNRRYRPRTSYTALVSTRWNLARLDPHLDTECVKVLHIDTAHILYQNAAEAQRLLALQERRGVTLRFRRFEQPCLDIEYADHGVYSGNGFTRSTYEYAGKPLYQVPATPVATFDWDQEKDFKRASKGFLWMGSYGMVLKGLDIVLEAFAEMPDFTLYVCGPVEKEEDFVAAYRRELYEHTNIHVMGWVDVTGPQFKDLLSRCVGQVNLSASEAGCGAVITGMHAGLVPVVSRESSVDVDPSYGLQLDDCAVDRVRDALESLSTRSAAELREMSRSAWEHVRAHHSRERFTERYRDVMEAILP